MIPTPAAGAAIARRLLPATLAVLLAAVATAASAEDLTRNQIYELQFRLNQLGFDAGRPDGSVGGRTRAALSAFASANDTIADLTPAVLAHVRAEARSVEGIQRPDGSIDFLVFTDQGTPLVLTVEAVGRIHKTEGEETIRDYDTDGSPIYSNRFSVSHVEATFDLPREAGVVFGVKVNVPGPPRGERLRIDHVVSRPERLADGTVRFEDHVYDHIYLKQENNPRYWYWHFETQPDESHAGDWRFHLENAGEILMSRVFRVGE
jgi:peptidoglycan hydrolase-like protein with peptidoglycan-binding domain